MNYITDTITTIESIFQMQKKSKIFSVPFQNFGEKGQKGTKRDMKVLIIYQFF